MIQFSCVLLHFYQGRKGRTSGQRPFAATSSEVSAQIWRDLRRF